MFNRTTALFCLLASLTVAVAQAQTPLDRGVALLEEGKTKEALAQFEAALRSSPKNPAAAYWMGRAVFEHDPGKAAEWFEKAVKLKGGSSDYHLWLGRAYGREAMRANPFKQASLARKVKAEFENAVQFDPENIDARSGLVEFYMMAPGIMGGSEEKAMQQAAEIGRRNPIAGFRETAKIHRAKGRFAETEKTYVEAIRKHGGNRDLRRDLGFFYQQRSEWQKAHTIFNSLIVEDPADMASHYHIGRTAAMSGQFLDAGERSLQKYLGHRPQKDDPPLKWAYVRLGAVYEKKNRADLARAAYSHALKLDPSLKEAKEALAKIR